MFLCAVFVNIKIKTLLLMWCRNLLTPNHLKFIFKSMSTGSVICGLNKDAVSITITGSPDVVDLNQLETWMADNVASFVDKKAVIVDLTKTTYGGSRLVGLIVGMGRMRLDAGLSEVKVLESNDIIRHLFEITGTTKFVKFLEA